MPKQVIADTFETLGSVVQGTGKQVADSVKKAGGDIAAELGLKQPPAPQQESTQPVPAHTPEQYQKIEEAAKKRAAARYREIQEEIKALQKKREKEVPKQVSGKPGFSEEKAVRQLEEKKEEEKKLLPLPVQRASKKTEMFRGTSG